MNLRRYTASVALTALLLGTTAMPALADKGGHGSENSRGPKVSEKFEDMGDFEWGLGEVTKMFLKGYFQGRGESIFAPGAKINHQESAVAVVRLLDKETAAKGLTAAEVTTLLSGVSDAKDIADWAKPSVAMLVKAGVLTKDAPFKPLDDATRLDVAVLLVNALGYQAEAVAKSDAKLEFKDAHLIPANLVGYVKVAVDHKLITGYDDKTFRPQQAVKRIEMAVMMGRADRLVDREKADELKGTVKSVDSTHNSFVLTAGDKEISLTLAAEASIFIDSAEKDLVDLKAGMKVEVKLNKDGKVAFIEAKSAVSPQDPAVTGSVTALVAGTATSLPLVSINNVVYPLSPRVVITVNGQTATFADLQVGDTVKATTNLALVVKLEVTRPVQNQTVSGTVSALVAATATTPAKVTVTFPSFAAPSATQEYTILANAAFQVNGRAAQFADLKVGDSVKLTLTNGQVSKVDVTRAQTMIQGSLIAMVLPGPAQTLPVGTVGLVSIISVNNGSTNTGTYAVTTATQVFVNAQAAQFANLQLGDAVKATFEADALVKLEVTR